MTVYIATCTIGVFAFDEKKNTLTYSLFQKNPEAIARAMSSESLTDEERKVLNDLKNSGVKEAVIDKSVEYDGIKLVLEKDNLASKELRENMRKLSMELSFAESQQEFNEILSKVNIQITKLKLQKPKKDKVLMAVIGVIDELDKSANTFVERLREWYGLHSPEIVRSLQSNEKFAEIISKYGHRDRVKDEKVKVKSSSGMDFGESDVEAVQTIAKSIESMYDSRKKLEKYLESVAKETIPNTSAIAGPLLASRLLQLAGGLEKLSRMPSSTIQLLGAEKALFRHLKQGGKPPKFGVLFAHPLIQNSKPEIRGKVARLIAAKLTFASRIDAYSERNDGEKMRKELDEEVKNSGN